MTREKDDQKREMVCSQIISRGIKNKKIINAMLEVPRHLFVPKEFQHTAYQDTPLPIGFGQTISQPFIVALMLNELKLSRKSKVLEIGSGSGYAAAIISRIADKVYCIERIKELAVNSKKIFSLLGYSNIEVKNTSFFDAWIEKSPFDAILVSAATNKLPEVLCRQLKENGLLVIPLGSHEIQVLYTFKKIKENCVKLRDNGFVRFVKLFTD